MNELTCKNLGPRKNESYAIPGNNTDDQGDTHLEANMADGLAVLRGEVSSMLVGTE